MMEDLVSIIGTVGFPIAVTLFLLFERSKTTKELTKAIQDLTLIIKLKIK